MINNEDAKLAKEQIKEIFKYGEANDLERVCSKWECDFVESAYGYRESLTIKQCKIIRKLHEKLVDRGVL